MRLTPILIAATLAVSALLPAKESKVSKADKQAFSYSIGTEIARNLGPIKDEVELDSLTQGLKDALEGGKLKYSREELERVTREFTERKSKERKADQAKAGAKNREQGEDYLKANAKKDGVSVTKSGLQYEVIKKGDGPKPKASDRVKVHYTGTLIDGKVFDSSVRRGEPAVFGVTQVIPGWVEALQLMPVGSKWKLTIPSELAYGENGAGGDIGPDAVLVFEVELLGIEK